MLKALVILPLSFLIWFGLVRIFSTNKESSINVLSKKVLNDFNLVFRNILDILDSLFKSFIQIYELLGLILKNIVGIFKSLSSTFIKFINLFNVIGISLMSFISLCKGLYEETKNITLVNSFEAILNQTKSAKNNVVRLFKVKENDLNNKEITLEK
tara:strand:- start:1067 stop:1534 length:468 start_codon:yes stop_codon:yes gene_type:complete